jgi:hypothetical protein
VPAWQAMRSPEFNSSNPPPPPQPKKKKVLFFSLHFYFFLPPLPPKNIIFYLVCEDKNFIKGAARDKCGYLKFGN